MQVDNLVVEVRNAGLSRVGTIRNEDLDIEATSKFNGVDEWRVTIRNTHPMAQHLRQMGAGIVVTVGDYVFTSGPVTSIVDSRSVDDDELLVISGVSDDISLADMLAWPEPSNGDVTTQDEDKDVRTGPCETLMHAYVRANIGPDAPASRRVGRLSMGTDDGRGDTVTKRVRFRRLLPLLRDLAADGDLGFRIVQLGDGLSFETYRQRDHAGAIRLTVNNGRLIEHRTQRGAPQVTRAIVAGKGKGKKRYLKMVDTDQTIDAEEDWGRRIEHFVDARAIDKPAELIRAGKEVLVNGGFTAFGVQAVAAEDDGDMKFGRDWRLGDRVGVEIGGDERTLPVTGAVLRVDDSGPRLGLLIGDRHASSNIRFRPKRKRKRRQHGRESGGSDDQSTTYSVERRISRLESDFEPRGRTGAIELWAGTAIPDGSLRCNGTAYNIEDYPALFAEIGNTFGGDGVTTFAVPDLRNRFPLGVGSLKALGEDDTKAEVDRTPAHSHNIDGAAAGGTWNTPNTGTNTVPRSTAFDGHAHGGTTGVAGANHMPHVALHFIINT